MTIYIDGKPYEVEGEGKHLLEVCLTLGFNLPYFCWHPALHSVGACRQCAIKQFKDENDTRGRIVMACMTAATEGARISVEDPEAVAFRASVIEWLMLSHPHDCPVCDEGGECHLQDMTVMTGHVYRRNRFRKRTHVNQDLGPFLTHEMNRCIQCYRCLRFYRDYAGGRDFSVLGWHGGVYFGRSEPGTLESEFTGNLAEVCPTGVFTDKTLARHYTRKWDLQTAPSICVHCGLGCNTIPGERYGTLRRVRARFNGEVNGYFLCDRGRYGYEFVNSDQRLRAPLVQGVEVTVEEATARAAELLRGGQAIGIGSPRASLESNYALRKLVGAENFYSGMSDAEGRLVATMLRLLWEGSARTPSLREVERADAVLVLGEDLHNTAPLLALAVRQAALNAAYPRAAALKIPRWDDSAVRHALQEKRGPLFVATPDETKLDAEATAAYRAAPEALARLAAAVARWEPHPLPPLPAGEGVPRVEQIAEALGAAERPLVIAGYGCGSEELLEAAAQVAAALCAEGKAAGLCLTMPECNSLGLALLEPRPLGEAVQRVAAGEAEVVVVLENDLFRRLDRQSAEALLVEGKTIVLDHVSTTTTERAEVVLPATTWAECTGTLVNNEGRAQRFFSVFVPEEEAIRASWRWLGEIGQAPGEPHPLPPLLAGEGVPRGGQPRVPWTDLDELLAEMAEELPALAGAAEAAPGARFRELGQRIPRQPHRYSGRTAMTANRSVHEPQSEQDPDGPLSYSMEGYPGEPPSALLSRVWAPGWNSAQATNKFQVEVGGALRGGDPGVRLVEPEEGKSEVGSRKSEVWTGSLTRHEGEWLLLPAWHIFGSEELSALAPGVAELAPEAYVGLSPADAERLGVAEGREVVVEVSGEEYRLPVRLRPGLDEGVALLPVGLREGPRWVLPAWGRIIVEGGTGVSPALPCSAEATQGSPGGEGA